MHNSVFVADVVLHDHLLIGLCCRINSDTSVRVGTSLAIYLLWCRDNGAVKGYTRSHTHIWFTPKV